MASTIRHGLTQCQNCWISKGSGVTFSRCSGCQIDIYCSKQCQRAAWPVHKTKCRLNSRREQFPELAVFDGKLKALRAFTGKHRPTLCECGVRALELGANIGNAEDKFLVVRVRTRAGAQRAELSFVAEDVGVMRYDALPPASAAEMKAVLRDMDAVNRRQGSDGTFFIMVLDVETGVRNNAPVGFSKESTYATPMPYREMLFRNLNEGIVL